MLACCSCFPSVQLACHFNKIQQLEPKQQYTFIDNFIGMFYATNHHYLSHVLFLFSVYPFKTIWGFRIRLTVLLGVFTLVDERKAVCIWFMERILYLKIILRSDYPHSMCGNLFP